MSGTLLSFAVLGVERNQVNPLCVVYLNGRNTIVMTLSALLKRLMRRILLDQLTKGKLLLDVHGVSYLPIVNGNNVTCLLLGNVLDLRWRDLHHGGCCIATHSYTIVFFCTTLGPWGSNFNHNGHIWLLLLCLLHILYLCLLGVVDCSRHAASISVLVPR